MELIPIFFIFALLVTLFAMGKKDFDNLHKVIQVGITLNTTSIVSTEIDFDLPRGFIAKIWHITLDYINWMEDLEGLDAQELNWGVQVALVKDPDDATSTTIPENSVQHDVIIQFVTNMFQMAADGGATISETIKELYIPEHVDLITARNMRFNVLGGGPDGASLTESAFRCKIDYTLEKVTDADILELLDIL